MEDENENGMMVSSSIILLNSRDQKMYENLCT